MIKVDLRDAVVVGKAVLAFGVEEEKLVFLSIGCIDRDGDMAPGVAPILFSA